MELKAKKAVLFDLDGTLMNTEPLHEAATVVLFQMANIQVNFDLGELKGKTDADVFYYLEERGYDFGYSCDEYVDKKNEILLEMIDRLEESEIQKMLTPGITEFLRKLWQQGKILLVVSASETPIVHALIQKTGISGFFYRAFSNGMTHLSKPYASPYMQAMRYLRLKTSEVAIFEDSPTGLLAARTSGARTFRVTAHSDKLETSLRENRCFDFKALTAGL